jgi:hypothetical protein
MGMDKFRYAVGNIPVIYPGSHGDKYKVNFMVDSFSGNARSVKYYTDYQSIMNIGNYISR